MADSYGNEKLIRKWIKSVFFIRDQTFGQSNLWQRFCFGMFRQVWVHSDFSLNQSKLVYAGEIHNEIAE